jgi:hypothetical protein
LSLLLKILQIFLLLKQKFKLIQENALLQVFSQLKHFQTAKTLAYLTLLDVKILTLGGLLNSSDVGLSLL